MQALLEGVEYHPIGMLNLAISPWMSDRDVPDIDPAVFIITLESMVVEVGTQICDDVIREPIAMHDLVQEVEYSVSL